MACGVVKPNIICMSLTVNPAAALNRFMFCPVAAVFMNGVFKAHLPSPAVSVQEVPSMLIIFDPLSGHSLLWHSSSVFNSFCIVSQCGSRICYPGCAWLIAIAQKTACLFGQAVVSAIHCFQSVHSKMHTGAPGPRRPSRARCARSLLPRCARDSPLDPALERHVLLMLSDFCSEGI